MDSHILWALIMAFSVVMYTIFDGFDLGVGILMPLIKNEQHRNTMVNSITPVWDGNETWIVLMGVGLFGGFPNAYSLLLPALYLPVIVMVLSLALRGVAMEYRFITIRHKYAWTSAFMSGSILAAFCQGIILGNLMEGIVHTGDPGRLVPAFRFLTPFTLLTGLTLVMTYGLIGANWLNFKTTGSLQKTSKSIARVLVIVIALLLLIIIYGRFHFSAFRPRFGIFGLENILAARSLIWYAVTGLLLGGILWALNSKRDWIPFALNILFTIISAVFIVSGFWPYIVPPAMTIFNAGSPSYGNSVLLTSACIIIPVILAYLVYSYLIFKGKVTGQINYDPKEDFGTLLLRESKKINGESAGRQVDLLWPVRIIVSLAGLAFFFIVLGFLGDAAALSAILLFAAVFLLSWRVSTTRRRHSRTDK